MTFSVRFSPSVTMYKVDISQLLVNLEVLMKIMLEDFSFKLTDVNSNVE